MTRREFLGRAGLIAGGVVVAGQLGILDCEVYYLTTDGVWIYGPHRAPFQAGHVVIGTVPVWLSTGTMGLRNRKVGPKL